MSFSLSTKTFALGLSLATCPALSRSAFRKGRSASLGPAGLYLADRKTTRIVVEPAAGVPPVRTDRVVVAAALDNLVSNAIKYSQPGKQIHVRVCSDAGWGVCEVRDKGPGRPASVVE